MNIPQMTAYNIQRIAAFLIDLLLISVAYTVLYNLIPEIHLSHEWLWRDWSLGVSFGLFGIMTAVYFLVSDLLNKGESPGKDMLGLRTVSAKEGSQLGYQRSLGRTLLKLVSICILPLAAFLYLWKGRGFTLQDYLVKTRVILNRKVP
jgi:uncharacterized RDD family membrane protein YckC